MSFPTGLGRSHNAQYDGPATNANNPKKPGTRPSRVGDIIEAAIRLFGARGIEHVTVDEIAAESGLVARAVYYHFATKDDVVRAAFARVRNEVDEIVARAADLQAAVQDTFAWGTANVERAQLLWVHSVGATPAMSDMWEDFITKHSEATQRYRSTTSSPLADDDLTGWIAARTAVIAGVLIQRYWGSGNLLAGSSPDDVADAVTVMFSELIGG
jgi:AcrR family transcriptional regulator